MKSQKLFVFFTNEENAKCFILVSFAGSLFTLRFIRSKGDKQFLYIRSKQFLEEKLLD